ncbi:MAG: hypothetical protein KGZ82_13685 [Bacteroidales bacterium]|nr:hypothetical protein [Bacteroidales bacterium]
MKNLLKKIYLPLCVIAMLFSNQLMGQKSVELLYNMKQGEQFTFNIKTSQDISMEMQGQSMVIKQGIELVQDVLVASVQENKHFTLDFTYKKIKFNQNAMGMDVTWDSENPEANANPMVQQIAQSMNKIIGSKVSSELDQYGNPVKNIASEVMAENQAVSGFESGMLNVFPDHKVKVGDTWQVEVKPEKQSDFLVKSVYKLEEVKGKVATISFEGVVTGTEAKGQPAKISGTISGKTQVTIATGWIISASVNQAINMEMENEGMKMPIKMNSYIEMTSK